jgi:two-component system, response regulator YesN
MYSGGMKRLLLVDDERSFAESLSLLIKRELHDEFEVAGLAFTGREAIEKVASLSPDIVVMDLRMPGLSGLDAIKEMRSRGASPVFILVTAYERFDTAREAVTLGVADYLLKPVQKERLFHSLRTAALAIERQSELERRIIEQREREERMRDLVEAAFLQAIMLGEDSPAEIAKYLSALSVEEGRAVVGSVAFLAAPGPGDSKDSARLAYEAFCSAVRYKSRAVAGPLVRGHCVVFLPLKDDEEAGPRTQAVVAAIESALPGELERGRLKYAFAPPCPARDSAAAWRRAVRSLGGGEAPELDGGTVADPFDDEEEFIDAVEELSSARASLAVERLCEDLDRAGSIPESRRFRVATLLGSACRILAGRKALSGTELEAAFSLGELVAESDGPTLGLAFRARFDALRDAMERFPRGSDPVQEAIAHIAANFERQLTLESVADVVAMSPGRLGRRLAIEAGRSFSEILIDFRVERAKELLSRPDAIIKQVSLACGYSDQNYFSRLFKKKTGLTPTAFAAIALRSVE